mmetsp:Transcript_61892/g.146560  ORF Transcript_61892/g.146560 Transcript_61892/m.146560 type:complete len:83 (-) Transcript_61892:290-538(-)
MRISVEGQHGQTAVDRDQDGSVDVGRTQTPCDIARQQPFPSFVRGDDREQQGLPWMPQALLFGVRKILVLHPLSGIRLDHRC